MAWLVALSLLLAGCSYTPDTFPTDLKAGDVTFKVFGVPPGAALSVDAPLPGARARVTKSSLTSSARQDGRVYVRNLPAGTYGLRLFYDADKDGVPDLAKVVDVPVRVTGKGIRSAVDLGTVVLLPAATVTGSVVMEAGANAPFPDNIWVVAGGTELRVPVDPVTHTFTLKGLGQGAWTLAATAGSHASIAQGLSVTAGETKALDSPLVLRPQAGTGFLQGSVDQPPAVQTLSGTSQALLGNVFLQAFPVGGSTARAVAATLAPQFANTQLPAGVWDLLFTFEDAAQLKSILVPGVSLDEGSLVDLGLLLTESLPGAGCLDLDQDGLCALSVDDTACLATCNTRTPATLDDACEDGSNPAKDCDDDVDLQSDAQELQLPCRCTLGVLGDGPVACLQESFIYDRDQDGLCDLVDPFPACNQTTQECGQPVRDGGQPMDASSDAAVADRDASELPDAAETTPDANMEGMADAGVSQQMTHQLIPLAFTGLAGSGFTGVVDVAPMGGGQVALLLSLTQPAGAQVVLGGMCAPVVIPAGAGTVSMAVVMVFDLGMPGCVKAATVQDTVGGSLLPRRVFVEPEGTTRVFTQWVPGNGNTLTVDGTVIPNGQTFTPKAAVITLPGWATVMGSVAATVLTLGTSGARSVTLDMVEGDGLVMLANQNVLLGLQVAAAGATGSVPVLVNGSSVNVPYQDATVLLELKPPVDALMSSRVISSARSDGSRRTVLRRADSTSNTVLLAGRHEGRVDGIQGVDGGGFGGTPDAGEMLFTLRLDLDTNSHQLDFQGISSLRPDAGVPLLGVMDVATAASGLPWVAANLEAELIPSATDGGFPLRHSPAPLAALGMSGGAKLQARAGQTPFVFKQDAPTNGLFSSRGGRFGTGDANDLTLQVSQAVVDKVGALRLVGTYPRSMQVHDHVSKTAGFLAALPATGMGLDQAAFIMEVSGAGAAREVHGAMLRWDGASPQSQVLSHVVVQPDGTRVAAGSAQGNVQAGAALPCATGAGLPVAAGAPALSDGQNFLWVVASQMWSDSGAACTLSVPATPMDDGVDLDTPMTGNVPLTITHLDSLDDRDCVVFANSNLTCIQASLQDGSGNCSMNPPLARMDGQVSVFGLASAGTPRAPLLAVSPSSTAGCSVTPPVRVKDAAGGTSFMVCVESFSGEPALNARLLVTDLGPTGCP